VNMSDNSDCRDKGRIIYLEVTINGRPKPTSHYAHGPFCVQLWHRGVVARRV
jgi:hypothetical protein